MGRCEYCKKAYMKSNGLSFHRFPEDEKLRLKWVENMGRTSWIPSKCSVLCSLHFNKNCIDFRDSRARLRKGSVPTIFEHNKLNDHSTLNNCVNTDAGPQTFEQHPHIKEENSIYENEIIKADETIFQSSISVQPIIDLEFSHTQTKINLRAVNHDHVYDDPPDIVKQKLGVARIKIKKLTNENHILRQKAKRARKTINSLKGLLSQLRELEKLCDNENNANRKRGK